MIKEKVDMFPMKKFFISSLVRDIDLSKAICDLIDNSIDGAKKSGKNIEHNEYEIKITLNKNKFCIKDNCGGISK